MYPFSQSVNPAVRTHLDAQTAFVNDMSKSLFQSFQQMCDLNIKLAQTMLEETTLASQQLLTADRQTELLSAAASRAQPASEKLRAYQQHISRLAADAQVELARVTEQHAQNTARTARALADEVARTTSEEAERGLRKQQEIVQQFVDPFTGRGNGHAQAGGNGNGNGNGHAQSQGNGGIGVGSQGANSGQSPGGLSSRGESSQAGRASHNA
ncbi:phasin family protein [Massilia sp. Dwa41.01b]|nr:phasin family protein [Massilia sp. Dwa41.01b]QNB01498.1 phasin family protein [Massilia sp. Se16.2.3]